MSSPLLSPDLLHVIAGDLLVPLEDRLELVSTDDVLEPVEALPARSLLHRIDDDVGRRRAVLQYDAAGRWQARGFVGLERRGGIDLAHEQPRQRGGVDDRLGAAVAALRIHGMGSVAEQRDAAEAPARERIAVDHRIGEDCVGLAHHCRHVEPIEVPVAIDRQEVVEPSWLVPVDRHGHLALDLHHPVDELVAGRIDVIANRIDDEGRMPRTDAGDGAAGEVGLLPRYAAPHIDAAIGERAFLRIELRPHRRMDAVACDQHVALVLRERRAVRRDEARGDAAVALLDADATVSGDEAFRAQSLAHRVEQHLVEVAAMDGEMRPAMPGGEPPRLAVDELAVAGKEGIVLWLAGHGRERVLQPELAELLHRVRAEIDPDAERKNLGSGLEYPDTTGGLGGMGSQRQGQPADAAADDDELHGPLRVNASAAIACRGAGEPRRWMVRLQYCLCAQGRALIEQSTFDCSLVWRFRSPHHSLGETEMRTSEPKPH